MSDRGMKKWLPFSSLVEQASFIEKMKIERSKCEKPILLDDEYEKINMFLVENPRKTHIFSIFDDGYIYKIETKIKRINLVNKTILFENELYIDIENLIDINDY